MRARPGNQCNDGRLFGGRRFGAYLLSRRDLIISTNTNIATKLRSEEFADFEAGPYVPNYDDVVGIIAKRDEVAWINYLNLFLVRQIRDGNMNEAYNKHFGTDAPADLIKSLRDNK